MKRQALSGATWWTVASLALVVAVIVAIQLALPRNDTIGPTWLIPFVELAGFPIILSMRALAGHEARKVRYAMNAFLIFLVAASMMNATLLFLSLLNGAKESGVVLLFAGFGVLVINVLSFGLVYWWLDGGGPDRREAGTVDRPDFFFPQQGMESQADWKPGLPDYMFTAYTNIIAFSPTDTMPLRHRVKVLFTLQSATSLLTILVTVSRAINLIPGN